MSKPNLVALGDIKEPSNLPKFEVTICDIDDPRSVVNLLPKVVSDSIKNVSEKYPHYLTESEADLYELLRPLRLDEKLRVGFWHEYYRAQDSGQQMLVKNIYGPFVSHKTFYQKIITNPQRLAWIICKPSEQIMSMEASMIFGIEQLDKFMKMKLFDDGGKLISSKDGMVFLKAFELLANRVKGAVVQRIEQKTASMHLHGELDEQADELRAELDKRRAERGIIEVQPTEE